MNKYYYLLTYNTDLGKTKQVRINDANPSITAQALHNAVNGIMEANVFVRDKIGRLESVKSKCLVSENTVKLF
jgi:hypothetical protein